MTDERCSQCTYFNSTGNKFPYENQPWRLWSEGKCRLNDFYVRDYQPCMIEDGFNPRGSGINTANDAMKARKADAKRARDRCKPVKSTAKQMELFK